MPESQSTTILLVEDEPEVRNVICRVLGKHGFTVLQASDGQDALQLLSQQTEPIDLLISDVVMPNMNGIELRKRLLETRPDLKVIFLSGYPEGMLQRETLATANTYLMEKPFTPGQLADKVKGVLGLP